MNWSFAWIRIASMFTLVGLLGLWAGSWTVRAESKRATGDVSPQPIAPRASGDRAAAADTSRKSSSKPKFLAQRLPWADVEHFHRWRIQQHVETREFRLLDGDDRQQAAGSRADCQRKLGDIRADRKLPGMSGEAVILVHGILRSSKSMGKLRDTIEESGGGLYPLAFDYASTHVDLEQSAEYLHSVIESLDGIEKIHFVTHSMGGLVVRAYLAQHQDPRLGRMVMIATPNRGADLAQMLHNNSAYQAVFGPAGQQLITADDGFISRLPTPDFEFGIIAGCRGSPRGYNPLIPGDDDGTVSVASTRLAGARDFVMIRKTHTFLNSDPQTGEFVVRFLKEGRFHEDEEPHPILAEGISRPVK